MLAQVIYLRLKPTQTVKINEQIKLKDIAWISTNDEKVKKQLETLYLYTISEKDHTYKVFDLFKIIEKIHAIYPEYEIESVGPPQAILNIYKPKTKLYPVIVGLVWLLLFIGSAMAIMNFHFDVSMDEVQTKLHQMISSNESERSILWLRIPYSIGLGLGMVLFFNHFFKKRFNEEPSPLEIEMFNYDSDIRQYVSYEENDLDKDDDV